MAKISMKNPVVEMDGDEMTRVIWQWVKDILILPYVQLLTEYYDLGLKNRDKTDDNVTIEASHATLKYGVAVKCATITPNAERVKEYNLKKMYPSPNGTIRAIMDGTVFRAPILVDGILPYIPSWTSPIIIARHAYGDIYKNVESRVNAESLAELTIKEKNGGIISKEIFRFNSPGVVMGMHNTDSSIYSFCRSCFNYALAQKMDLWFASKDTISKIYDHRFKDIFYEVFEKEFKTEFEKNNINYLYTLIDDAVARVIKSKGGFIWACKNYDGDVFSDMIATAFGSLAMMTSVLVSPDNKFEFEAAHGTVTRHYYKYLKNEETSTNSVATIFAWTGALKKRGELDNNLKLIEFSGKLEAASLKTIENGVMTKDLIDLFNKEGINKRAVNTKDFLLEIAKNIN